MQYVHFGCCKHCCSSGIQWLGRDPERGSNTMVGDLAPINPFRTTVPFLEQTTWVLSGLSPRRDCSSKRVNASEGRKDRVVCYRCRTTPCFQPLRAARTSICVIRPKITEKSVRGRCDRQYSPPMFLSRKKSRKG